MRISIEQMSLFMPPPPPAVIPELEPIILPPEAPEEPVAIVPVTVQAEPHDCEWVAFIRQHGCTPALGDAKQPWEYKGWLMYYRLACEDRSDVVPRWNYWAETMQAGRLLDKPIPKLVFHETTERDPEYKLVDKWIELVHQKNGTWDSVRDLMDWFLWGFAAADAPPKFSAELNEALYRQVNIGPLLLKPADYFGSWVSFHKGSWNPHAFFPTPMHVVTFMNQMTFGTQAGDCRLKTVADPCVGTGRFLMDASNHSLCLSGIDIDPTNLAVAKVNAYLYAPWLARPLPESITGYKPGRFGLHCGNSLSQEMTDYGLLSEAETMALWDARRPPKDPDVQPTIKRKRRKSSTMELVQ